MRRAPGMAQCLLTHAQDEPIRCFVRLAAVSGWPRRFAHGMARDAGLEKLESRLLLALPPYVVTVTDDSLAAGTLRSAILAANQDADPNPFDIVFNIPASTAPELNVPVPGFDPVTQTWQITLNSPLPAITHPISIDGFSQANNDVPYRYSDEIVSTDAGPDGAWHADWRNFHAHHRRTPARSHDGTDPLHGNAGQVQNALAAIVGNGNVAVASLNRGHTCNHVPGRVRGPGDSIARRRFFRPHRRASRRAFSS